MAEAFVRRHGGDRFRVFSAGLEASAIHPLTARVMEEVGLSLTGQSSKGAKEFLGKLTVRHLIVVCEAAERACPKLFPGVTHRYSWPFPDPVPVQGGLEARLAAFRDVRDAIERRVREWLDDPTVGRVGARR